LFTNRSGITESDQGRSFRAFYDLLLSSERQAELSQLLERLHEIDTIPDLDPRLARVHYDWIDASERTQTTVRRLSEQLRRFLDDKVWMENRRVFDLIHSIEMQALRLRDEADPLPTMELDDAAVPVVLPMERPLYARTRTTALEASRSRMVMATSIMLRCSSSSTSTEMRSCAWSSNSSAKRFRPTG